MAQRVSNWPVTAETWIRKRAEQCDNYSRPGALREVYLIVLRLFSQFHSTNVPYISAPKHYRCRKQQWTKPRHLQSNALSHIWVNWRDKYLHMVWWGVAGDLSRRWTHLHLQRDLDLVIIKDKLLHHICWRNNEKRWNLRKWGGSPKSRARRSDALELRNPFL
jgi:hypothetical protein